MKTIKTLAAIGILSLGLLSFTIEVQDEWVVPAEYETMANPTDPSVDLEIGKALYIYAGEHKGAFPASLETLYDEEYLADRTLMDCPAAKKTGTPSSPDYNYTGGLSVRDPSQRILVQDRPGNHPQGGRNVLLVDGTATWRPK